MAARLLAILLVYHPPYARPALGRLHLLLQALDPQAPLLVVSNNPAWRAPACLPPRPLHWVAGDNRQREFSGWDRGLAHARAHGLMDERTLVLLANDSFCVHNRFGRHTEAAFIQSLRLALAQPEQPALIGEAYGLDAPWQLDGLAAERWVSTHLFGITAPLLRQLHSLCSAAPLDRFFGAAGGPSRLSSRVSANLAAHIEQWMDGGGRRRWPGRSPGQPLSDAQWRDKVGAILLEKHLSARASQAGAQIVDVLAPPHLRWLRRVEWLHWHWQRLSGRLPPRVRPQQTSQHGHA